MKERNILVHIVLPYLHQLGFTAIVPDQSFGVGSRRARADAIAYGPDERPMVLIEIKIDLGHSEKQLDIYHPVVNRTYKAAVIAETPYFLITDGQQHFWFIVDWNKGRAEPIVTPPSVETVPTRLRSFTNEGEVEQIISIIADTLRDFVDSNELSTATTYLLEAKITDEHLVESGESSQFDIRPNEDPASLEKRIHSLAGKESDDGPIDAIWNKIPSGTLQSAVGILQPFSLLKTDSHILSKAFKRFIVRSFQQELGQYFTPEYIIDFMIRLLAPRPGERVIDPVCGTGSFLTSIVDQWRKVGNVEPRHEIKNLYGIDIDSQVAQIAKLNVGLASKGQPNIFVANSLDQKRLDELGIHRNSFDVVVANPPFGIRIDEELLGDYQLTGRQARSEDIFLEQFLHLLKDGGRLAVIVPESFLFNRASRQIRERLLVQARLDAVVSLPTQTFAPASGIRTSIIVLTKGVEAIETLFMAQADNVGVDRRGQKILENDLTQILADYNKYKHGQTTFDRGWAVKYTSSLAERMDVSPYHPSYQNLLTYLQELPIQVERLGVVAKVHRGTMARPRGFFQGGIPIVGPRNIGQLGLELDGARYCSEEQVRNYLEENDILLFMSGTSFKSIVITQNDLPLTFGNFMIAVRLVTDLISSEFLRFLFSTNWIQDQISANAVGGAIPRLTPRILQNILIPIPSKPAQVRVLKRLEEVISLRQRADDLEKDLHTNLSEFLT